MKLWNSNGKHSRRKGIPVVTYLVLLLIATFLFTGISFSKHVSTTSGDSAVSVAKFDFKFDLAGSGTQSEVLEVQVQPGFTKDYSILVSDSSEVATKYKVVAKKLTDNTPLEATLTVDGKTYDGTEFLSIDNGDAKELTLSLEWDAAENAAEYAGEVDAIRITVIAEQID